MSQDSPASEVGRDRRESWGTLRHMATSPHFACGRDGRPGGAASPRDPVVPARGRERRPLPGLRHPYPRDPRRQSPPRAPFRSEARAGAGEPQPRPPPPGPRAPPPPQARAARRTEADGVPQPASMRLVAPPDGAGRGPRGGAAQQAGGRTRSARHAGKRSSACRLRALAARAWTTLPRGPRAISPAPPRRLRSLNAGGGCCNTSSSPRPAARAGWPFEELLNSVTATL